jgi:hypothetical protein
MAKLPDGYKTPKPPEAADMKIGETWAFSNGSLAEDEEGNLFLPDAVHPMSIEANVEASSRTVFVRRDPDGLVLILRPRNKNELNSFFPKFSCITHRPIIRVEEEPE